MSRPVLLILLFLATVVHGASTTRKHGTVDNAPTQAGDTWTSDEDTAGRITGPYALPVAANPRPYIQPHSDTSFDPGDYLNPEANIDLEYGSDEEELDEEYEEEEGEEGADEGGNDDESYFEEEYDDLDLDSEEDKGRVKRKVIFGGGGGYGGVHGRRGGGSDPYGRRRGGNQQYPQGSDYGYYETWPARPGYSYEDEATTTANATVPETVHTEGTPAVAATPERKESEVVYGTQVTSPSGSSSSAGSTRSSSSGSSYRIYNVPDVPSTSGGTRKKKPSRRESKKKLSKALKWEIAQYAIQHGIQRAEEHYADRVERKLSLKKIDKFVKRYQKKQQKNSSNKRQYESKWGGS